MEVSNFYNYGTMNQVEAGATQINNYYNSKVGSESENADENRSLPEALLTEEAQEMWEDLREAGFIVPDGYALAEGISANQATYIADRMATQLGISKKWKVFGELWGIKNMAQLAGSWQQTGKLPPRSCEIDKLI